MPTDTGSDSAAAPPSTRKRCCSSAGCTSLAAGGHTDREVGAVTGLALKQFGAGGIGEVRSPHLALSDHHSADASVRRAAVTANGSSPGGPTAATPRRRVPRSPRRGRGVRRTRGARRCTPRFGNAWSGGRADPAGRTGHRARRPRSSYPRKYNNAGALSWCGSCLRGCPSPRAKPTRTGSGPLDAVVGLPGVEPKPSGTIRDPRPYAKRAGSCGPSVVAYMLLRSMSSPPSSLPGGSVSDAAELVGVRPSTAKRHLADLRARSGLTTEQLIYSGRAEGWLVVPSLEDD